MPLPQQPIRVRRRYRYMDGDGWGWIGMGWIGIGMDRDRDGYWKRRRHAAIRATDFVHIHAGSNHTRMLLAPLSLSSSSKLFADAAHREQQQGPGWAEGRVVRAAEGSRVVRAAEGPADAGGSAGRGHGTAGSWGATGRVGRVRSMLLLPPLLRVAVGYQLPGRLLSGQGGRHGWMAVR